MFVVLCSQFIQDNDYHCALWRSSFLRHTNTLTYLLTYLLTNLYLNRLSFGLLFFLDTG